MSAVAGIGNTVRQVALLVGIDICIGPDVLFALLFHCLAGGGALGLGEGADKPPVETSDDLIVH